MAKKLTHHESFQPFSRGLIAHMKYLSGNAIKLFTYILLRVKATGEEKGCFSAFVFDCCEDLGWIAKTWYKTLKEIDSYIEYKNQKSRHHPFTITVKKYKGTNDFYNTPNGNGNSNSNKVYRYQKGHGSGTVKPLQLPFGNGNGTVTPSNPQDINDLTPPKKEEKELREKVYIPALPETKILCKETPSPQARFVKWFKEKFKNNIEGTFPNPDKSTFIISTQIISVSGSEEKARAAALVLLGKCKRGEKPDFHKPTIKHLRAHLDQYLADVTPDYIESNKEILNG